jgi:hypothetical protein
VRRNHGDRVVTSRLLVLTAAIGRDDRRRRLYGTVRDRLPTVLVRVRTVLAGTLREEPVDLGRGNAPAGTVTEMHAVQLTGAQPASDRLWTNLQSLSDFGYRQHRRHLLLASHRMSSFLPSLIVAESGSLVHDVLDKRSMM